MLRHMLKSKIHRATVTFTDIDYEGSISIDPKLMKAAGLLEYEQVHVVNLNNGSRLVTYVIKGHKDGEVGLNGAAARLCQQGDKIIIIAYSEVKEKDLKLFKPNIIVVDDKNRVVKK